MKSVLVVVSEVGYSWDEVVLPYQEFVKAGLEVVIATPTGQRPKPDALSAIVRPDWLNWFGVGTSAKVAPDSAIGQELTALLRQPVPLAKIKSADFEAIYVAGGHGSLFDLNKNSTLHQLILEFDSAQKPIGILCHASSTLTFIKTDNGNFATGKNITGFPTWWERFILTIGYIEKRFLPLPIWTGQELDQKATGRTLVTKVAELLDPSYTIVDGRLVTGVGPESGGKIAQKLVRLMS